MGQPSAFLAESAVNSHPTGALHAAFVLGHGAGRALRRRVPEVGATVVAAAASAHAASHADFLLSQSYLASHLVHAAGSGLLPQPLHASLQLMYRAPHSPAHSRCEVGATVVAAVASALFGVGAGVGAGVGGLVPYVDNTYQPAFDTG
jgi:hypothetical protein